MLLRFVSSSPSVRKLRHLQVAKTTNYWPLQSLGDHVLTVIWIEDPALNSEGKKVVILPVVGMIHVSLCAALSPGSKNSGQTLLTINRHDIGTVVEG
jgi:hypothetical protein